MPDRLSGLRLRHASTALLLSIACSALMHSRSDASHFGPTHCDVPLARFSRLALLPATVDFPFGHLPSGASILLGRGFVRRVFRIALCASSCARVRAGILQQRICSGAIFPEAPGALCKNPWTHAMVWSWGRIFFSRGAPPTAPFGSRRDASAASPKPETLNLNIKPIAS